MVEENRDASRRPRLRALEESSASRASSSRCHVPSFHPRICHSLVNPLSNCNSPIHGGTGLWPTFQRKNRVVTRCKTRPRWPTKRERWCCGSQHSRYRFAISTFLQESKDPRGSILGDCCPLSLRVRSGHSIA